MNTWHIQEIIDIRDIIERFEELDEMRDDVDMDDDAKAEAWSESEEAEELALLEGLLDDLKGSGGDEEWRGSWYPSTLIHDRHFKNYAMELADDIGAIDANARWPLNCIDWNQAAEELKSDYSTTEINGSTFWYR